MKYWKNSFINKDGYNAIRFLTIHPGISASKVELSDNELEL